MSSGFPHVVVGTAAPETFSFPATMLLFLLLDVPSFASTILTVGAIEVGWRRAKFDESSPKRRGGTLAIKPRIQLIAAGRAHVALRGGGPQARVK